MTQEVHRRSVKRTGFYEVWPGADHPPPGISERNWQMACEYVTERALLVDLAEKYGVTSSRVRQILDDAYRRLIKQRWIDNARVGRAMLEAQKAQVRCTPRQRTVLIMTGKINPGWLVPNPHWLRREEP